jgi:hypothetical protein
LEIDLGHAHVKNFVWKVGHNLLPTKENLHIKHVMQDPLCPVCQMETESVGHILWSYRSSQAMWQGSTRRIHKLSIHESDGMLLLQQLKEKLEEDEFIVAIVVAQLIWLRRNSFVFENLPRHLN